MAVRKTNWHPLKVRERIQTSQLINRLENQALGRVELSQNQLKAIEILLKKSCPI